MHKKNCTVFYRPLRHLPVERQREMCEPIFKRLDAHPVEYIAGEHGDDRDEWIKRTRRNEVAVVAKIEIIAEPRTKGRRPSVDFAVAVQELVQQCQYVIEAASGITSKDGAKWKNLLLHAGNLVVAGRVLTPQRAKKMAGKRWAVAEPGVVKRWQSPSMAREHARWSQHWRDPKFKNDEDAFQNFPAELREEFGSPTTARRIFKNRRPGDKSVGGRPPSTKRKR